MKLAKVVITRFCISVQFTVNILDSNGLRGVICHLAAQ